MRARPRRANTPNRPPWYCADRDAALGFGVAESVGLRAVPEAALGMSVPLAALVEAAATVRPEVLAPAEALVLEPELDEPELDEPVPWVMLN